MPSSAFARCLIGRAPSARPAPLARAASVALVAAALGGLAAPAAAQTQSALWRSAARAAGIDASVPETAWERALRAGPSLADERFGWRHTWYDTGRYTVWTGMGGAMRESRQAFSLGRGFDAAAGLSPMLAAGGEWRIAPGWRLMAEFDGIGGPRGRTLDFDARLQWDLSPQWYLGTGWRVLDATYDGPRGGYGRWSGAAFSAGWRF